MKVSIIGTVSRLGEEKTFGDYRRREIIIADGGDESKPLPVEFSAGPHGADRVAMTSALQLGDLVRVQAFLSGREWEGRVYLRLVGYTIEKASFKNSASELPPPSDFPPKKDDVDSDLPF